ncbi:hypothetical protein [Streptomyces sp. NPDC047097]|uniref:DUF6895 family protein n=1 Tax=Streptomyces sp. NPDC047097 TaxID=3155260 RepID=UPI003403E9D6
MDATTVRLAHRVGDGALAWLGRLRSCFALPADAPVHEIPGDELKALSELALATGTVLRAAVAGPDGSRTAKELMDFAWRELREGDLLYAMQRHGPGATHPREVYAQFAAAGYRHPRLDALAAHLASLASERVVEHVPNRRLAVLAAHRRIGIPDPPGAAAELTARTWLGGTPEPWMLDVYSAYGVTHTVFHLTDWGADPSGLPGPLREYLERWLPVWVEVFAETRSWDLLGELLVVGVCLERPLFFPEAWERYAAAQRADGMMPNGVSRPPDDPRRAFLNHHHPTIVAVVAGTVTVQRALDGVPAGAPG